MLGHGDAVVVGVQALPKIVKDNAHIDFLSVFCINCTALDLKFKEYVINFTETHFRITHF